MKIDCFYGCHQMVSAGNLSFFKVWHHNPILKMTADEQYRHNEKIEPGSCKTKLLPPALKPVFT